MKKKLAILLIAIILLPLTAIGILGYSISQNDTILLEQAYQELAERDLDRTKTTIDTFISDTTQIFERICHLDDRTPEALREQATTEPYIRQYFVVNADGRLAYPIENDTISEEERSFLERTAHLWSHRHPFRNIDESGLSTGDRGYSTWYHNRGLHFIYWVRQTDGQVVGFEAEASAYIAALIAQLPDTAGAGAPQHQVRLLNEKSEPTYVFGGYTPPPNSVPVAIAPLPAPLSTWSLQYFAPAPQTTGMLQRQTLYTFLTIATLVFIALLLFAYFLLEYNREARLARQQTSFVNQVSHELKTPLTNIRMYAELLQEEIDDDDDTQHRYLNNIVNESGRLSRLIQNVLSFARSERKKLVLHPAEGIIDQQIENSLKPFQASFTRLEISVERELNAATSVRYDADVLGQILTNLFSNVEKYAHQGKRLHVTSNMNDDQVTIRVSDNGPGIAPADGAKLFKPFTRLQCSITEGVTGTGIGLAISKELARLHGGDLTLCPQPIGSCFQLTIQIQRMPT